MHRPENQAKAEDQLRALVLDKAANLGLPVRAENIEIQRSPESLRIDVRYVVHVDLPLYTVDLHFHPGVGAR